MKKFAAAFLAAALTFGGMLPAADGDPGFAAIGVSAASSAKAAAPKDVTASAASDSVTLEWNAVKGASRYRIYRYDSSDKKYKPAYTAKETSYTIKDLKPGKTYYFKVAALVRKDGKYTAGELSRIIKVKTLPAFPKIKSFGFEDVPISDDESGEQMQSLLDMNPGMQVGLITPDRNADVEEQLADSLNILDNYCTALEEKGFVLDDFTSDVLDSPDGSGSVYVFRCFIGYEENTVGRISFSIYMTGSAQTDEEPEFHWAMLMVMPGDGSDS